MATPSWLRRQLAGPTGWLARPVAFLLDRFNRAEYVHAFAHLPVKPDELVLELGFGGGVGIGMLLERGARVLGVEPAVAMRARAFRRHAWELAEGRLQIVDARAEALPDGPFDHALSMNTAYFWDDVPAAVAELRRTVRGSVVLGVAPVAHLDAMGFRESGFRVEEPAWYGERLAAAGFVVEVAEAGPGTPSNLVIGRTPEAL